MNKYIHFFIILALALTSSVAMAGPKRLAVLEFQGDAIPIEHLQSLADAARSGAVKSTNRIGGIEVYTRENQARFIREMGGCEDEGECEVDTLQNIGADYGITGSITLIEGMYIATLSLYDVRKGSVMDTAESQAEKLLALREDLQQKTTLLVDKQLSPKTGQSVAQPSADKTRTEQKGGNWFGNLFKNMAAGVQTAVENIRDGAEDARLKADAKRKAQARARAKARNDKAPRDVDDTDKPTTQPQSEGETEPEPSKQLKPGLNNNWFKFPVYYDTEAKLLWEGKAFGIPMNWHQAKNHCTLLIVRGYTDWRLPTTKELQDFFNKDSLTKLNILLTEKPITYWTTEQNMTVSNNGASGKGTLPTYDFRCVRDVL